MIKAIYKAIFGPMMLGGMDGYQGDYWNKDAIKKLNYTGSKTRFSALKRYIKNGSTLLDVGCGNGEFIQLLRDKKNIKCEALEISKPGAELVRKMGFKCQIKDLSKKDKITGKFDYVTCNHVIEHIQDAEKIVENFRGKAKERVMISVPNAGYFLYRLRLLFGRIPMFGARRHVKNHIRHWTVIDFCKWINWLGFDVVKVVGYGDVDFLANLWPNMFAAKCTYIIKDKKRK